MTPRIIVSSRCFFMYFFAPFLFVSIYFSEYQKSDQKNTDFSGFHEIVSKKIQIKTIGWDLYVRIRTTR